VENVNFLQKLNVSQKDYLDNYQESAIRGGTIRLADKNAPLEDGQFLTFDPPDSIRSFLHLRLTEESISSLKTSDNKSLQIDQPFQGLKVDISGETKRIDIGLNDRFPVVKIPAIWLESWMPRDAFIALIAFLSTLVATLICWRLEMVLKKETET
jgi:hypothetical protein